MTIETAASELQNALKFSPYFVGVELSKDGTTLFLLLTNPDRFSSWSFWGEWPIYRKQAYK